MPRSTLRGLISRGIVPIDPHKLVDTVDLEQAGFTLQPEALADEEARQQGKRMAHALDSEALAYQEVRQQDKRQLEILLQAPDLFRQIQDEFQRELDAAHARQIRLLHLMGELHQYVNIAVRVGRAGRLSQLSLFPLPKGEIRQPILTLLREYPQGLTRKEIETKLSSPKNLRDTLQGMYRDGLVERPKPGIYTIASKRRSTEG
jgi:hypothetical protein